MISSLLTPLLLSFSLGLLRGVQICGFACGAFLLTASRGRRRGRYILIFFLTRVSVMAALGAAIGFAFTLLYVAARSLEVLLYFTAAIYTALAFILLFSGWRLLSEALERLFPGDGARWVERERGGGWLIRRLKGPVPLALLLSVGCVGEVTLLEGALLTAISTSTSLPALIVFPLTFGLFAAGMNAPLLPVGLVKEGHMEFLQRRPLLYLALPSISIALGILLLVRYAPIFISALL